MMMSMLAFMMIVSQQHTDNDVVVIAAGKML